MRRDGRESDYVEDRRGQGGSGLSGLPLGGRGLSIGAVLVAVAASYFLGVDPRMVLGLLSGSSGPPQVQEAAQPGTSRPNDPLGRFVSVVLADTEDTWAELFRQQGATYRKPTLVLFSNATRTACGMGQSASGPFYCPADQKVYIDLSFYRQLQDRFQAPGDFAQAYVIAHEVGHHVQHQLGIMSQVQQLRSRMTEAQSNALSVRVELQADCFAGIWAHHAQRSRQILQAGDVEEALRAATAIGDDSLQRQAQSYVVPESFTHGSAAQRVRWFRAGLESGRMEACNTFEARKL